MLYQPPRNLDALDGEDRGLAILIGDVDIPTLGNEVFQELEMTVGCRRVPGCTIQAGVSWVEQEEGRREVEGEEAYIGV